jgi:hypothetical protein
MTVLVSGGLSEGGESGVSTEGSTIMFACAPVTRESEFGLSFGLGGSARAAKEFVESMQKNRADD